MSITAGSHGYINLEKELAARLIDYHKKQLAIFQSLTDQQNSKLRLFEMLQKPEPDWNEIETLTKKAHRPQLQLHLKERPIKKRTTNQEET